MVFLIACIHNHIFCHNYSLGFTTKVKAWEGEWNKSVQGLKHIFTCVRELILTFQNGFFILGVLILLSFEFLEQKCM